MVGDVPNSVVYNNGPEDLLAWIQPRWRTRDKRAEGVTGSTGPNDVSPQASGGEAGNTGEDGTAGGGGNLSSGGGSGAPNGDTGGGNG